MTNIFEIGQFVFWNIEVLNKVEFSRWVTGRKSLWFTYIYIGLTCQCLRAYTRVLMIVFVWSLCIHYSTRFNQWSALIHSVRDVIAGDYMTIFSTWHDEILYFGFHDGSIKRIPQLVNDLEAPRNLFVNTYHGANTMETVCLGKRRQNKCFRVTHSLKNSLIFPLNFTGS